MDKKRLYTLISIAVLSVFLIANFLATVTLSSGNELKIKLKKFNSIKNCYYDIGFQSELDGDSKIVNKKKIQQFKKDKNYFAKSLDIYDGEFESSIEPEEETINSNSNNLKWKIFPSKVVIIVPVKESKKRKSFFWLDKITPEQIQKGSVKKLSAPDFIQGRKCDMYSAKLKTSGEVDLCIDSMNFPIYINYKNVEYSLSIAPLDMTAEKRFPTIQKGNVEIFLSNIILNPAFDSSFKIVPKGKTMKLKNFRREFYKKAGLHKQVQ